MRQDADMKQSTQQWIASLAVTIVCCAVFFLVFSGHFLDLHKEVTAARVETGMLEARLNYLESNVLWAQRRQATALPPKEAAAPAQEPLPRTGDIPELALPTVSGGAGGASAPVPLNVPHEFNPDEPSATGYATPIETPEKP